MVNKIVKVGNQIVSLGGGIINTPNPELEVNQTMDEEVTALLKEDVVKGDIVYEDDIAGLTFRNQITDIDYLSVKFFEYKGKLHCATLTDYHYYQIGVHIWRYELGEWILLNPDSGRGTGTLMRSINEVPHAMDVVATDDTFYVSVAHQNNGRTFALYRWTGSQFYAIDTPYTVSGDTDATVQANGFLNCHGYSSALHKDASGNIYVADGFYTGDQLSTANSGNCVKIYKVDTSTDALTQMSIEASATLGGFPRSVRFAEYNGSSLLIRSGPNPTNGVNNNEIWQIAVLDNSTQTWVKWLAAPQYLQHGRSSNFLTDSSGTSWLNHITIGGTIWDVITYYKGTSDSDFSMSRYAKFDTSTSNPQGIASFEANNTIYHVVGCINRPDYVDEDNLAYLLKYNGTSELEEVTNIPNEGNMFYRRLPDTAYRGWRGVDSIKYNGEIHVSMVRNSYGGRCLRFFKFDAETETLEETTPKNILPVRNWNWPFAIKQIDYQGSSFAIVNSGNFNVITKYEDEGYFSGTHTTASYLEDFRGGNFYGMTDLIDASSFRYAVGSSNGSLNILMYEFTPSSGLVEKLPGVVNLRTGVSTYNLAHAELSGNHYLFGTYWTSTSALFFAQVSGVSAIHLDPPDEATGMPHRSMYNTYCYVACADAIGYNGKVHAGYVQWQNYSGGSSINNFTWDGSSWEYIPIIYSGTDQMGIAQEVRGRCFKYHVHDGDLYLAVIHENMPNQLKLFKYDSSNNQFVAQPLPASCQLFRPYGFVEPFTYDGKLCLLVITDSSEQPVMLHIKQADGTWKSHILQQHEGLRYTQGTADKLIVNNELWVLTSNYINRGQNPTPFKFDPTYERGGWSKYLGGPLHYGTQKTLCGIGVALESGSKGQTIRVRRTV